LARLVKIERLMPDNHHLGLAWSFAMLETKMDQRKYEASAIGDAHTEDWFAARDWVASGERFRPLPDSTSQKLRHSAPGSGHVKPEVITAAKGV
jgi:hypothetical protein